MQRYLNLYSLFVLFTLGIFSSCSRPSQVNRPVTIAFYNVENLFDTTDDLKKKDDEFTPQGAKKWTSNRYRAKVNSLGKVLAAIGDENLPGLIGLCEVENLNVLEDLANSGHLQQGGYELVHFDSPDVRGIDNALLYRPEFFKLQYAETISVIFPENPYPTRDILYIKGALNNNEILHIFVNHWPSRVGGQKRSEQRRMFTASVLRKKTDDIFQIDSTAKIIIMGDMNDEPVNRSVSEVLRAGKPGPSTRLDTLFNMMMPLNKAGEGSYNYQGKWNMLDQIIVSGALLNGKCGWSIEGKAEVFHPEWMEHRGKKYSVPSKTYGGNRYFGGFSDHFPVRIKLKTNDR